LRRAIGPAYNLYELQDKGHNKYKVIAAGDRVRVGIKSLEGHYR
jgi:hypothetical protein